MELERICIESNLFKGIKVNAYLISMPKTCKYKEYVFWHPTNCIKTIGNNSLVIYFLKDFKFKLEREWQDKSDYKEELAEKIISAEEFKKCFEKEK